MRNAPTRQKITLFDAQGRRKYLTDAERTAFLVAAATFERETRTFCMTLHATGCRISEGLFLTGESIDFGGKQVVIESLKKRRGGIYRAIPVSDEYLDAMVLAHGLQGLRGKRGRLWPWSRRTATRRVDDVMKKAEFVGPHSSAKGLRHGFAIAALQKGIPLNMVSKWLGHADLETTAIYANAVGAEERALAARMWG